MVAVFSHLILSYQCMCSSKNNLWWQSCLTLSYLTNACVLQRTIYSGSLVSPYLILQMHVFFKEQYLWWQSCLIISESHLHKWANIGWPEHREIVGRCYGKKITFSKFRMQFGITLVITLYLCLLSNYQ